METGALLLLPTSLAMLQFLLVLFWIRINFLKLSLLLIYYYNLKKNHMSFKIYLKEDSGNKAVFSKCISHTLIFDCSPLLS